MVSKEYEEFLLQEQVKRKLSLYELACKYSEKIFRIAPFKSLDKPLKEAIEFSHLNVTPKGAFSVAFVLAAITLWVSLIFLTVTSSLSISSVLFAAVLSCLVVYFTVDYPFHHATVFRIKASSEMVLAITYINVSMRTSPNLERAIEFASRNLTGPLAIDLRQVLWDIYTRKFYTIDEALENFINKWKRDANEFAESLYVIKTSLTISSEKREKALDEAISIIIEGTKERMRTYAQELKTPLTVINALGILLPVVGLVFFPIVGLFLPDLIKPVFLIFGYDIFLPLSIYFLMKSYLEKRPYTFHQPDLSKHPGFAQEKLIEKPYFIPWITSGPLVILGTVGLLLFHKELYSFKQLAFSMLIVLGISWGLITYFYLSVRRKLKLRKEIVDIENEFAESLFQLGTQLTRGIPFESALEKVTADRKTVKISAFFEKILTNIKSFGMTLERAVFEKSTGAINYYPSKIIETTMTVIVETSKRGMMSASKAMLTVSTYLKSMHTVDEELKMMLEEVTSTMKIQAILLAPLSAGVVVALAALMTGLLVQLGTAFESIYSELDVTLGPVGTGSEGLMSTIVNLDAIIPIHSFQLVVGIYMIEIVVMLAIFLSVITNGEEDLIKRYTISQLLTIGATVYFASLLITYLMFTSLVPISKLIIA